MATLTSSVNLACHINLIISFYLEARFKYCSSYSFVWDEVWTEANTWKVWFGCKDGTLSFSSLKSKGLVYPLLLLVFIWHV